MHQVAEVIIDNQYNRYSKQAERPALTVKEVCQNDTYILCVKCLSNEIAQNTCVKSRCVKITQNVHVSN